MLVIDEDFHMRCWGQESLRPNDERDQYQRDKARVVHSSAFRRLQAKTQVMGVGEGDFHRTRLTHSIEVAQIGEGLLGSLQRQYRDDEEVSGWLPSRDLIAAACLAHDLGHPPFGHGGERALHGCMVDHGGFEGNAQTLRIVTRLDKYKPGKGMNPTRRFVLAVLKYPFAYSTFEKECYRDKPPKCFFDSESDIVDWAMREPPLNRGESDRFFAMRKHNKKRNLYTLDCSILEYADDIAYGVHDLEDIVSRRMVQNDEIMDRLQAMFEGYGSKVGVDDAAVTLSDFEKNLFGAHHERKGLIGKLVNLFVTSVRIDRRREFTHPLIELQARFDDPVETLLVDLKKLTHELVVQRAEIQQLERRGKRIVRQLYEELLEAPSELIPLHTWNSYSEEDSRERRVCDYIASMTDPYAERIYRRLFIPGQGSSRDEL